MHFCKRVWKLPFTRLRRSSSIAATSSAIACFSSGIIMIRLRNTRSFRNPHRRKSGTVRSGDRADQAMSPKLRTHLIGCCTFQRSIATDHMKWRPLLYLPSSCQSWQAIVPAQYSNFKCVSRLRNTLYKKGDKADCSNNRGRSRLTTTYKIIFHVRPVLEKNGNTMKQSISYLQTSRKLMIQLG